MLIEEQRRRQDLLKARILELAKESLDESEIRKEVLRLLDIYSGGFRHSYADFFPIISEISQNEQIYALDFLTNNLSCICKCIEDDFESGKNEFTEIHSQINKLCDHLNLEIGRWNYYSKNEKKIEDLELRSVDLNEKMKVAERKLTKASKKASSIQTELIAVLSIFAAIVTTFSGSFTFLGSVMTSINGAEHYEAVVMAAIVCGMVIFNTLFLMMYMVGKITERNIYAKCVTEDCSCEKKCLGIIKVRKRLPYVFWFNLLCIGGCIVDLVIWWFDMAGCIG